MLVWGQKSCVVDVILASMLNKKVIFISHGMKHRRSENRRLVFQDAAQQYQVRIPGYTSKVLKNHFQLCSRFPSVLAGGGGVPVRAAVSGVTKLSGMLAPVQMHFGGVPP